MSKILHGIDIENNMKWFANAEGVKNVALSMITTEIDYNGFEKNDHLSSTG